jgi:hypothetical protein
MTKRKDDSPEEISDIKARQILMHPGSHRVAARVHKVPFSVIRDIRELRTEQAKRAYKTLLPRQKQILREERIERGLADLTLLIGGKK